MCRPGYRLPAASAESWFAASTTGPVLHGPYAGTLIRCFQNLVSALAPLPTAPSNGTLSSMSTTMTAGRVRG